MCCLWYVSIGDLSPGPHACWETILPLPTLPSSPLHPLDHLSPLLLFFITEFSPVVYSFIPVVYFVGLHYTGSCFVVPVQVLAYQHSCIHKEGGSEEYCGKKIPRLGRGSWFKSMCTGELALPLVCIMEKGEIPFLPCCQSNWECWPWGHEYQRAGPSPHLLQHLRKDCT